MPSQTPSARARQGWFCWHGTCRKKTAKEIRFAAEGKHAVVATVPFDKNELGHTLGYEKPVGVCAVDDKGLSAAIIKLIQPNKEDEAHDQ